MKELTDWYRARVEDYLGPKCVHMHISTEAATWLHNFVVRDQPNLVVEFGGGLSTLALAEAMATYDGGQLLTVDHDPPWVTFVDSILSERCSSLDGVTGFMEVEWWRDGHWPRMQAADLIFVDSGPSYAARLQLIERILGEARRWQRLPRIVVDDWHPTRPTNTFDRPLAALTAKYGRKILPIPASANAKKTLARIVGQVRQDGGSPLGACSALGG